MAAAHVAEDLAVPPLQTVELGPFLSLEFAEPSPILGRLLREGSLAMIHGRAGSGKTFLMLSMAIAAAYGVPFLGWPVQDPTPVLYVDGEMTVTDVQQRLKQLVAWVLETIDHPWKPLHVITPDLQPHGIAKIDTVDGRAAVIEAVARTGARLVFLDNLSCLTNPEDDNASSSWSQVQELLLTLRRRHCAVVVGHHSGKNGEQRGTSRRADILDLVLKMTPVTDGEADGRTRVSVEFEKGRSLRAEEKEPFVATLEPHPKGGLVWSKSATAVPVSERIRQMLTDGMPPADIATELKTARSFVYRIRDQMKNSSLERRVSPVPSYRGGLGDSTTRPRGQDEGTNRGQWGTDT
jgi:KaiC/GvpD/RAD55 family RecA-like ATPase